MNLSVVDRESIDLKGIKLLDLFRPRRVHFDLACLRRWAVHQIHFRAMDFNVADCGMFEDQRMPLQGKVHQRRREKWDWDFAAGLFAVDDMDLIGAAPEMERDGLHMRAIPGNF